MARIDEKEAWWKVVCNVARRWGSANHHKFDQDWAESEATVADALDGLMDGVVTAVGAADVPDIVEDYKPLAAILTKLMLGYGHDPRARVNIDVNKPVSAAAIVGWE